MRCLEVHVNGEKVCLAGRSRARQFHATVTCWNSSGVQVNTGGVRDLERGDVETYSWGKQDLKVGDDVRIVVVESEQPDDPIETSRWNPGTQLAKAMERVRALGSRRKDATRAAAGSALAGTAKPHCSFCGKGQNEVANLIAGPSVFICNECIAICNYMLAGTVPASHPPRWSGLQKPTPGAGDTAT